MVQGQATILIVDDTPDNLSVLGELLQPAYRVRAANSGRRALQIAHGHPTPDLILLDVMMPEMDGFAVLAELRNDPVTRSIPVIFVTAMDGTADEEHGLDCGAVDYITKPLRPTVVLARVRTHLELKRARDILSDQNSYLEAEVARRMGENQLIQRVSIHALARLAETRDPGSGDRQSPAPHSGICPYAGPRPAAPSPVCPLSGCPNHRHPRPVSTAARHWQGRHSRSCPAQTGQADRRRVGNHENPCQAGQ